MNFDLFIDDFILHLYTLGECTKINSEFAIKMSLKTITLYGTRVWIGRTVNYTYWMYSELHILDVQ
jgi:hypothetical protein